MTGVHRNPKCARYVKGKHKVNKVLRWVHSKAHGEVIAVRRGKPSLSDAKPTLPMVYPGMVTGTACVPTPLHLT